MLKDAVATPRRNTTTTSVNPIAPNNPQQGGILYNTPQPLQPSPSPAPPPAAPAPPPPVVGGFVPPSPPAAPPPPPPAPQPIAGQEISPVLGNVSDPMLVAKQLEQLTNAGSPYLEQASARARQVANSRGLGTSSIAAMSGEEAAIAAALPIAQQDASTHGRVQSENLGFQNQFNLTDKNAALQQLLQGNDIGLRRDLANQELKVARANQMAASYASSADMQLRREMLDKEIGSRERLAGMELDARRADTQSNQLFQERMQNAGFVNQRQIAQLQLDSQTQANLMQMEQNSFNQWAAGLNNIMTNTNMSAEDRTRAQQNWTAMFAGNPYFPYRPATSAYTPAAPPPAPAPAPAAPPPEPAQPAFPLFTGGRP
jgi:hypothetical protein